MFTFSTKKSALYLRLEFRDNLIDGCYWWTCYLMELDQVVGANRNHAFQEKQTRQTDVNKVKQRTLKCDDVCDSLILAYLEMKRK